MRLNSIEFVSWVLLKYWINFFLNVRNAYELDSKEHVQIVSKEKFELYYKDLEATIAQFERNAN